MRSLLLRPLHLVTRFSLFLLLISAAEQLIAAPQPIPLYTGVLPPNEHAQAWGKANLRQIRSKADLRTAVPKTLPARVVNTDYLPNVGRQSYGSCTSWAIVYYYKTWQEAKEHHWLHPNAQTNPERVMSPAFIFNLANAGLPFSGTSVNTNFEYLLRYGTCSVAEMEANAEPSKWPDENQYLAAFAQRAQSAAEIAVSTQDGLDALKAHLAGDDLAVFTMTLFNNFTTYPAGAGISNEVFFRNDNGIYIASGASSAGHELCIIGYDDNKAWTDDDGGTHKGAMLVVNSWGTTWGANLPEAGTPGFIWLSYDYFMAYAQQVAIMEDRIGYQPTLVGAYHISHDRAAEVDISLLGGDRNAPDWTLDVFPGTGGLRPIDATVAFDATDYTSSDNLSWWLRIADVSLNQTGFIPNGTGQVTSFKIKRTDGGLWTSPDTPVQTVEVNLVHQYAWANIGLLQRHDSPFENLNPAISESAWGDLDGDGDQDVIFMTSSVSAPWTYAMHVYRNEGDWQFVEVESGLPVVQGAMALGDYDADGLPDLALNGYDSTSGASGTWLWHNQGQCRFTISGATLPNSANTMQWIDFNQDGRLDLALNTWDGYWSQPTGVKLLLNQGHGVFTDANLGLPRSQVFAWADYNRDGLLDLALADFNGSTYLYRNTGGALVADTLLYEGAASALAWGDADNDGWLDLALCTGEHTAALAGTVLRNGGSNWQPYGTFSFMRGGGMAWGDVDNDGFSDLITWGDLAPSDVADKNIYTRIYRNRGQGVFQNLGFNLWGAGSFVPGLTQYVHPFDLDQDGDLDLAVCGPESAPYPQPRKFRIYENFAAQTPGLNRPNTPPAIPTGLIAGQPTADGAIELKWNAATDAESANGLYYDLRVGSNPGWGDLLSANTSPGLVAGRLHPALSGTQWGYRLQTPPTTAFYWSVRAIDPAQGASPWSAAMLFVPSGAKTPGDANADGHIDVADLVSTIRIANGLTSTNKTLADRNHDGGVDLVDVELMRSILLANAGPDARTLAAQQIDASGGKLSTTGIEVQVPAGAFAAPTVVGLEKIAAPDATLGRISPRFRIVGLPSDLAKPLTIRLHAEASPGSGTVMAGIREQSRPTSAARLREGLRYVSTAAAGSDYTFTLGGAGGSTLASNTKGSPRPKGLISDDPAYKLTVDVDLDSHQTVWANSKFKITFDATKVDLLNVAALGAALQEGYDALKETAKTGGFSYANRTNWPVEVTVLDMNNNGLYGLFYGSKLGDNYGWIEINSVNITSTESVRSTAIHEFFHLVQNLYDPRWAFNKATRGGPQLWLNEASSVWSEGLLQPADYVSPQLNANILSPFNGLIAGAKGSDADIQNHGYGLASLIKYLIQKRDTSVVLGIWNSIHAGATPANAIKAAGPTQTDFSWWTDFILSLITSKIYLFGQTDINAAAPEARQFKIQAATDIEKQKLYTGTLPDLSAQLHMALPLYAGFDATHRLACRLARDEGQNLQLHVLKAKAAEPTTLLGEGVPANGALKFEVTDLASLQSQTGWRLLPLVTNQRAVDPANGQTPYRLTMAVVGEGTHPFALKTITSTEFGFAFPVFKGSGSLQGRGWAEWYTLDVGWFNYYYANVPALPPITYTLNYSVTIDTGSFTLPADAFGEYEVLTVPGIKRYRFEFYKGDLSNSVPTIYYSDTGSFTFELTRDDINTGGTVYALYDVVRSRYNSTGGLVSQSTTSTDCPVVGLALLP
jgi:hypothetical protein